MRISWVQYYVYSQYIVCDSKYGNLFVQNCIGRKLQISQQILSIISYKQFIVGQQKWVLYPQQWLYLISIISYPLDLILDVYSKLNGQAYNCIQVLNFYVYVRKSGKFLERKTNNSLNKLFNVYNNKDNYYQKINETITQVSLCQDFIKQVLFHNNQYKIDKICIIRNRDFIFLKVNDEKTQQKSQQQKRDIKKI